MRRIWETDVSMLSRLRARYSGRTSPPAAYSQLEVLQNISDYKQLYKPTAYRHIQVLPTQPNILYTVKEINTYIYAAENGNTIPVDLPINTIEADTLKWVSVNGMFIEIDAAMVSYITMMQSLVSITDKLQNTTPRHNYLVLSKVLTIQLDIVDTLVSVFGEI